MDKKIRRGDIYFANLDPVVGSEQGGIRPVLIIQNNKGNKFSRTTIAAPITSKRTPNSLPVHVFLTRKYTGLEDNSCVLLEQLRVIDKRRLLHKVGYANAFIMKQVDSAIRVSTGLKKEYN